MKILALGCLHGRAPTGLESFVKKNKIDFIFSLGDHCDGDILRDAQFKNWDAFKGKDFYKAVKKLLGILWKKEVLHFQKSGERVLKSLDKIGVPVYVVLGNNDFMEVDRRGYGLKLKTIKEICSSSKNLNYISGRPARLKEFFLIADPGYRGAGEKSMKKKKHARVKNIWERKLEKMFSHAEGKKIIFIGHDQPFNCKLDKIVNEASPMNGKHFGDEIIREFILKKKPEIYLGAHMHEHWGMDKIGKTKIVACGYGREGKATMLELPSLKVKLVKIP